MTTAAEPMVPAPYQVTGRVAETRDSATLRPLAAPQPGPRPGFGDRR